MQTQNLLKAEALEATVINQASSNEGAFILANTLPTTLWEIQQHHIIPVYSKDNEPLISHGDFIEATTESVHRLFPHETILNPVIRVSHPIKGRVPTARNKPAKDLEEWEKTLYYERAAFVIEIPSLYETIDGNTLSLTIGGVKAYNLDSLHQRKGVDEHFKLFIGFQNKVCTNLCIWSDGYVADLRVKTINQLKKAIVDLVVRYQAKKQLECMSRLMDYYLTEHQFAQLVGRCRLYQYLPPVQKKKIIPLLLGDSQVNTIARDYYHDSSFCRSEDGSISLWKIYNLFTGAVKSSYLDTFLDRNVNSFHISQLLLEVVQGRNNNWFLQ
ncbi:DUF3871 family protein [Spirosoma terrae]|uniref:DUF3871 family protein n=1 Tax=Spirosoma terrae TaxID=1968276 RepID=A0A6L9LIK1_9BACT|nr:DUF3871 family protein [Spirosoma terrae]NDU99222.1 DUF3871 family protein [Spirosoma terrae]